MKSFGRLWRQIRDTVGYLRTFRSFERRRFKVLRTEDPALILQAKKIHAAAYLRRGFVTLDDIDQGILTTKADPHQQSADYFVVIDTKSDKVVATARQIKAYKLHGHYSFPTFTQAQLYERSRRFVEQFKASDCVEISGLAKAPGVESVAPLLLYRAMWQYSLQTKHQVWIMACDVRLYERLRLLFGDTIRRAGKTTPYFGGDIVPALIVIPSSLKAIQKALRHASWLQRHLRKYMVDFLLWHLPVEALNNEARQAYKELKHDK